MENVDIKLNNGEVAFVSNGVNMIMNTATLLELCEKLGVIAQQNSKIDDKPEDKCKCKCQNKECTCTSKKENVKQDDNEGYRRLLNAVFNDAEDETRQTQEDDNDKTFDELVNEVYDQVLDIIENTCYANKENDEKKDEEVEDDYTDEEDEEVEDDGYSRIVAVRYNPYPERGCIRNDWRDGLREVVGVFETADDAADKFGVKSTSDVIKSADTWESIGALLSDKIISVVNMKQNDEIKYYAKDMLDKDIAIQLYCMTDYTGNEYVAFMYEDDVDENLPLYHEVLFKNEK